MRRIKGKNIFNILFACVFFFLGWIHGEPAWKTLPRGAIAHAEEGTSNPGLEIEFFPLAWDASKEEHIQANSQGDSFIISVGTTQILVDAGASATSGAAIVNKMKSYLEKAGDTHWEYIIITHPDGDHLSAFSSGDPKGSNIDFTNQSNFRVYETMFMSQYGEKPKYTLGKLIDFDITQDNDVKKSYNGYDDLYQKGTAKDYVNYSYAREKLIKGQVGVGWLVAPTEYTPVSKLCKSQREYIEQNKDNLTYEGLWNSRATPIPLSDDGKITLNFLYNYHNDHREGGTKIESADYNNLSVCFTIDCEKPSGEVDRLLFTGDLEEFDSSKKVKDEVRAIKRIYGESDLIKYNPWLKEGVIFYKAAHHGSKTSNSDDLMYAIRPKKVVIPAIAGGNHGFPHQEALDSIFAYTNDIAIMGMKMSDGTSAHYYGNIMLTYNGEDIVMSASNRNMYDATGRLLPLEETEWFTNNRTSPCKVIECSGKDEDSDVTAKGNSSIVKSGDTEILVDCGLWANTDRIARSDLFLDKVKRYCSDGVIECLLVSTSRPDDIKQLIDEGSDNEDKGVLHSFEIKNIVTFAAFNDVSDTDYGEFCSILRELQKNGTNVYVVENVRGSIEIADGLSIEILSDGANFYGYSVDFHGKDFLFPRPIGIENEESFLQLVQDTGIDCVYMRVPEYGAISALTENILKALNDDNELHLAVNGITEEYSDKQGYLLNKAYCNMLRNNSAKICLSMGKVDGVIKEYAGDIIFTANYDEAGKTFKQYDMIGIANGVSNTQNLYESEYFQSL